MNGSAPKLPATGSQSVVQRKLSPNFARDSADCTQSSHIRNAVSNTTAAAKMKVTAYATSSPLNKRRVRPDLFATIAGADIERHWICEICFNSISTTDLGSGA